MNNFVTRNRISRKKVKPKNAEYSPECLEHEELRSTYNKGLEVPCQNTFKDKPAFIKRLIKVLVARNLFLVHSSCKNNRLV